MNENSSTPHTRFSMYEYSVVNSRAEKGENRSTLYFSPHHLVKLCSMYVVYKIVSDVLCIIGGKSSELSVIT